MELFLYLSTAASFENIWPGMIGWFLINIQIQLPSKGHSSHFANGGKLVDGKAVFEALKYVLTLWTW